MNHIPVSDRLPASDRLIMALDVDSTERAEALVRQLDGTVRFFKIGLHLLFRPGADRLIDGLIGAGHQVFLDYKMFDIPQTVQAGVAAAAARGISFVTVHGDPAIMRAAVAGRERSAIKVFAVSVLTSLDDAALRAMGHSVSVPELVALRVRAAADCGCDGVIASAQDDPDALRRLSGRADLLITTPGIRPAGDAAGDQARTATPEAAIASGADYLVVGRPIVQAADPRAKALDIIGQMEAGQRRREGARNAAP